MWGVSYWVIPAFSACVWLAMLLAMLIHWLTQGSPKYPSMEPGQKIAYISDVGAQSFKPLFIAMAAVTVVTFDIAILAERWLRHRGRLTENTSWFQKGLSILGWIAAVAGAAGIILLSIFDTWRHPRLHRKFLVLFIVGYVVSAIFITIEYQRLSRHFKHHPVLKGSFWLKLAFIVVEVALAIAFGVESRSSGNKNVAAILEWVIALIFTGYIFSFFMDLVPAVRTKHHQSRETEIEGGTADVNGLIGGQSAYQMESRYGVAPAENTRTMYPQTPATFGYANGDSNGYSNGNIKPASGIHNGTYYPDGHLGASQPVAPSRNF